MNAKPPDDLDVICAELGFGRKRRDKLAEEQEEWHVAVTKTEWDRVQGERDKAERDLARLRAAMRLLNEPARLALYAALNSTTEEDWWIDRRNDEATEESP